MYEINNLYSVTSETLSSAPASNIRFKSQYQNPKVQQRW
jgi:hypothetical protein